MANKPPADVSIGKFDILATYVYTQDLLNGLSDEDAKQRGMVAAIMGAQARLGIRKEHHEEFKAQFARNTTKSSRPRRKPLKRRKKRRSLLNRSTSRSPTRWASSSTKCFFRV
jgi:hypothetical protein